MHDTDPAADYEIDSRLLEVLVCPLTRGPLTYDRVNHELISHQKPIRVKLLAKTMKPAHAVKRNDKTPIINFLEK